jgi:hypothetical protein
VEDWGWHKIQVIKKALQLESEIIAFHYPSADEQYVAISRLVAI